GNHHLVRLRDEYARLLDDLEIIVRPLHRPGEIVAAAAKRFLVGRFRPLDFDHNQIVLPRLRIAGNSPGGEAPSPYRLSPTRLGEAVGELAAAVALPRPCAPSPPRPLRAIHLGEEVGRIVEHRAGESGPRSPKTRIDFGPRSLRHERCGKRRDLLDLE